MGLGLLYVRPKFCKQIFDFVPDNISVVKGATKKSSRHGAKRRGGFYYFLL